MYTSNLCSQAQTQADERTCDSSLFYYPTPCKFARIGLLLPWLWFSCCWSCIGCDVRRLFSGISFFRSFVSAGLRLLPVHFLFPKVFWHRRRPRANTHSMQVWILGFCGARHSGMKSFHLAVDERAFVFNLGDDFFLAKYWKNILFYLEPSTVRFSICLCSLGASRHSIQTETPNNYCTWNSVGTPKHQTVNWKINFTSNISAAQFFNATNEPFRATWSITTPSQTRLCANGALRARRNATNDIVATMITWRTVSIFLSFSAASDSSERCQNEFVMPVRRTSERVGRCSSHVRADWERQLVSSFGRG